MTEPRFIRTVSNPFRFVNGDFRFVIDVEAVKETLEFLLQTRKGEWFANNDLGAGLGDAAFEQGDEGFRVVIKEDVEDAVAARFPQIVLDDTTVIFSDEVEAAGLVGINVSDTTILVRIVFQFRGVEELQQLVLEA